MLYAIVITSIAPFFLARYQRPALGGTDVFLETFSRVRLLGWAVVRASFPFCRLENVLNGVSMAANESLTKLVPRKASHKMSNISA